MLQPHPDNDRGNSRFQRRRTAKSPLHFRTKIRELEEKMDKHHRLKEPVKMHLPLRLQTHPPAPVRPLRNTSPQGAPYQPRSEPRVRVGGTNANNLGSSQRPKPGAKPLEQHRRLLSPQPMMTHKQSDSDSSRPVGNKIMESSQQNLQELLEQNQRYKQIYTHSVQRLRELQQRLYDMRRLHGKQKQLLQGTIQNLAHRIEMKRNTLAHIYTYESRTNNLLPLHDRIITETDNENSSSHLEEQQRRLSPSYSALSIESK